MNLRLRTITSREEAQGTLALLEQAVREVNGAAGGTESKRTPTELARRYLERLGPRESVLVVAEPREVARPLALAASAPLEDPLTGETRALVVLLYTDPSIRQRGVARALVGELRRALAGADLVHVQDAIYAASVAALVLAHGHRIPSVLTQHVAFVPQGSRLLNLAEQAALATLGRSARLATRVATYNPAVADWARRHWGLADVRVLPVGVVAPNSGDRAETRRSFGLDEDRFLAVFVGRDVHKKGLDVFLGAADPAYQLAAVTDRPGRPADATFLPFMPPERLGQLLASADAFVLPSEGEGFPLSLQEAMAAGLPVVTTRHEGYERFLGPDDALFVKRSPQAVRAALLRLAADGDLVGRLGARSRALAAENFGVERFVDAYEALYDEARASPRPVRRRPTG